MFRRIPVILLLGILSTLIGCARQLNPTRIDYPMGERVTLGPLTYNVVETAWRSQLGDTFKLRLPERRFLLVSISVTNGGGKEISMPLLSLENQKGEMFLESNNGEGLDGWFGLLRNLVPAQTQQGRLLFDVGLSSYRLRLTDGGEPGSERYAWIEIPLSMDADGAAETPVPGVSRR